jgi:hypothetical protein
VARFLFPLLLIGLGALGLAERDEINNQWAAMYPQDPAEQAALAHCAQEDSVFNRFSAASRATCYQKYLQPSAYRARMSCRMRVRSTTTATSADSDQSSRGPTSTASI